jgi:hypothetical protein
MDAARLARSPDRTIAVALFSQPMLKLTLPILVWLLASL